MSSMFKDTLNWSYKTKHSFRIIIVGAGVAGLTTALGLKRSGHDVEIFEQVHEIREVGAGIQMAPNNTRVLGRFGCLDEIMKSSNILKTNSLRRWQNNEELGAAPLMPEVAKKSIHGCLLMKLMF